MAGIGDLVRCITGAWMVRPPEHCPQGHPLTADRTQVGHQPCGCARRGGHMTWRCRECDEVVHAPPLTADCRPLRGAVDNLDP